MNRILSLVFAILIALCIEVGILMLIANWLGIKVAIAIIAVEFVLVLWTVYEIRHASDETEK